MIAPAIAPPTLAIFHCSLSRCKAELGLVSNDALYIGGLVLLRPASLLCLRDACGHETRWSLSKQMHPRREERLIGQVRQWQQTQPLTLQRFPTLSPVICFQCEKHLAHTDGARLYIGNTLIPSFLRYECLYCGAPGDWQPILKPCPC